MKTIVSCWSVLSTYVDDNFPKNTLRYNAGSVYERSNKKLYRLSNKESKVEDFFLNSFGYFA